MPIISASDVDALFEKELARITQPELIETIKRLRVPTRCEQRPWDYGKEDEAYPCWIVLEHPESNTCIAYCEHGFAPRSPWGLLFITKHLNIGMDSAWFVSLEEAVRDSMAWEGDDPPGYEAH
jgi:hypothetical protein